MAYLLGQTDEYIASLTKMVQAHKREVRRRTHHRGAAHRRKSDFEDEIPEGDQHVPVSDTETGQVLKGEEAPKASELDDWLAAHPR